MSRTFIAAGLVCLLSLGNSCAHAAGEDVTVTTSRRVHPVLIRNDAGSLLQIVVDVPRGKDLGLQAMHFKLDGTDDVSDLESLSLFATGDKQEFATTTPVGKPIDAAKSVAIGGDLKLRPGKNVFWLSCRLKPTANLSHKVKAVCTSVETTAGKLPVKDLSPAVQQRIGVALRKHKDDGVHTYRILALTTTPNGTLLCVYDMRRRMGRDLQEDIDIGLSRSSDGGQTWEPARVIMDMGKYGGLPEEQNGCSDPGIIVDHKTGEIFCFAVWMHGNPGKHQWNGDGSAPGYEIGNAAQMLMVSSKDDGRTLSKPVNLTRKLKPAEWWLFAPSPQQGINLADGTLVMPVQGRDAKGLEFSTIMTSGDHGETWSVGAPAYSGGSECQAVQLGDGSIMLNMRNERDRFRAVFVTKNLGKSWQPHETNNKTLIEPNCNGSLLRVDYTEAGKQKHALLFSNPHTQKGRTHQTIQVSFDDGRTWPKSHHLLLDEGRGAGYPSLTRVDERHVGIVYEGSQAHLVFEKFPLAELLKPAARSAAVGEWKQHVVRRLGGAGSEVRIPAKLQIVTESWNRVAAVPYIVYMPEKDRLLMLVSCDYPHRPMVLSSQDRGWTWSEPKPVLPSDPSNNRHLLGVSLTYLGGGRIVAGVEGKLRWFSNDYGDTWNSGPIPPFPGGGAWNQWDPYLVERDAKTGKLTRLMETGYKGSTDGGQEAYHRASTDGGKTWSDPARVPQWQKVSEVALLRAANGHLVAACRTDIPAKMKGESLDHYEGLGISISTDEGRTWSNVRKLYDWGRHHPSLLLLPSGEIVMTYVVRKGYIDSPDGFPQFGIEAVVSRDHGQTWDLDHRYLLHTWVGNRKGSSKSLPGPQAWWASSQATSSVLLPDGAILTAFGTGYRSQPNAQNMSAPRDVGLVQWRLSGEQVSKDRRIRDAAVDSDSRNLLNPRTGAAEPSGKSATSPKAAEVPRPVVKVVKGGESKVKPEDCRTTIIGPKVNQPDPFPG